MPPAPLPIADAEVLLASAGLAGASVRLEGFDLLCDGRLQARRDRIAEAGHDDACATLQRWRQLEPTLHVTVQPLDGAP
jgi:hypothetical protein